MGRKMKTGNDETTIALQILEHLKAGNFIHRLAAYEMFNTFCCSQRIFDLKLAGYDIRDISVKYKTPGGVNKHFKAFYLAEFENEALELIANYKKQLQDEKETAAA